LLDRHPGAVLVSAATGEGVDDVVAAIGDRLRSLTRLVELVVPYDRGDVVAAVHRHGEVVSEEHEAEVTRIRARLQPADAARFSPFRVASSQGAPSQGG
jgi:GTP-binding protein HflX